MRFLILNGSPKTEKSVTMQSIKYLEQKYPNHDFDVVHIIKEIKSYETDLAKLVSLGEKVKNADGVIWAFPVYHIVVPAHYKRFIELVFENGLQEYFSGKYTAVFTTSVHYADNIAHTYMRGICEDLGVNFTEGLSHEMNDLPKEKCRTELGLFFETFIMFIEEKLTCTRQFKPVTPITFKYSEGKSLKQVITDQKIIVITDALPQDNNLNAMIHRFQDVVGNKAEVINLNHVDIKGYCLGCCKCGTENICTYQGKDGYKEFLDHVITQSDIVIYAGTIRDRYLSSKFKLYFDRSFCYNHIPYMKGKQVGYLVSGRLKELENLKQIFELYNQGDSNLIGIVTDESEDNEVLDEQIYAFAKLAVKFSTSSYFRPASFLGVGGRAVFKEMLSGFTGAIFLADYKYYKKAGVFKEMPIKERLQNALMRYFMGKKRFRDEVHKSMFDQMISAHKKVLGSRV